MAFLWREKENTIEMRFRQLKALPEDTKKEQNEAYLIDFAT